MERPGGTLQDVSAQLANLRNLTTFPSFESAPGENDIPPDYYEQNETGVFVPNRHWCFLGEIKDFDTIVRLHMEIEDVNGQRIPIFFHTDGRGAELPPMLVQKGYTVAILYAQSHWFMSGDIGIRHEAPDLIKIFPISLRNLMAFNDRIQQFSTVNDGMRTCHACGKKGTSLQRCANCSFFWYCDKACQVTGWNRKGHKADCKLLKDPDLRGMFTTNWDEFEGYLQFPLASGKN